MADTGSEGQSGFSVQGQDVTPPVTFGSVSAVRQSDQISLNWKAAVDNQTSSRQLRYKIYIRNVERQNQQPVPAWTLVALLTGATGQINYTVRGLDPSELYEILVKAEDSVGNQSSYPTVVVAPSDTYPPVILDGDIRIFGLSQSSVKLKWVGAIDQSPDQNTLLYRVSLCKNPNILRPTETYQFSDCDLVKSPWMTNQLEVAFTGLQSGRQFWVVLEVQDTAGNKTRYPIKSFTTLNPLGDH